ncbi:TetR/AcrR family transcriptional regulator [Marisediminicola senii]|uniref:TetR/AcrR family transcriptional regulator n=1 Tax=Marisediminicola senii TaxID=2711233 RepID=UPI0013EA7B7A|nr:TetR/AcrR family transcriptional regulator [Marisediminicola senii]
MAHHDDITAESRALRDRIERAAIDLSIQHGYENVTIEMICEAGKCSRRTFFNHFGSKQGAILGPPPAVASAENVAAFVASTGPSILEDFVELMKGALTPKSQDRDLFRERRLVIASDPALLSARMRDVNEMERAYIPIILRRMAVDGRVVNDDPDAIDDAEMIITLTTAIMQFATQMWVRPGYTDGDARLIPNSMAILRRVVD